MKIVILDGYTINPGDLSWSEIEKLGELTVYDRTPQDLITSRIGEAEIVLTSKCLINEKVIDQCEGVSSFDVIGCHYYQ